ncbi:MAG: S1 RNA-binding domain-containing protein [Oscillospiraceae bacterium]|nr:S1 RNA-binding domain-containing protein [Oscillospiraceae bacterium]
MTETLVTTYQPEGQLIGSAENREFISSLQGLEKAMVSEKILEARAILCDNFQNLTVDLNGIKGIIEREETSLGSYSDGRIRDIAIITRVGKAVCFKVLKIEKDADGEPVVYLSRKAAQEECLDNYIMKLSCGDIIDVKVTHLEPFGCFCDVGCGVISLLPIDCISISRISHPSDRYQIGQFIKAIIKFIDYEAKKVSLTHKELLGTWEENAAKFQPGQTAAGIVRSVEQYGIFIELTPNLAGLAEYKDDIREGQNAAVYIKNIIPERMKIKLVLIDTYNNDPNGIIQKPSKPVYYIENGRIDLWRYSPPNCDKIIETNFNI